MRNLLVLFSALFTFSAAHAECNFNLAYATEGYILALEGSELYQHQGEPCKVLNATFHACSAEDQAVLSAKLDMEEVFGNICQPHLPH